MNGPVPGEWELRYGSAWSLDFASGPASPPLAVTTLLSRTPRLELERIGMIDGCDAASRTTTVIGSGAKTSVIPSTRNLLVALRFMTRSSDHFTSADVSMLPLTNFTLGRSLNV